jgi:hypothetical protein
MSDDDLPERQLFLIVPKRCRHVFENKYMIGEQAHLVGSAEGWRSDGTFLPSLSEHRDLQEAMLLVPAGGWIRTVLGTFFMQPGSNPRVRHYACGIARVLRGETCAIAKAPSN